MRTFPLSLVALSLALTAPLGFDAWAETPVCNGRDGSSYTDKLFTDLGNAFGAQAAWAGVSQLSGSEVSTVQVLELISQRRLQQNQDCPSGFVRVDGIC